MSVPDFGAIVREARERASMTQAALGEVVGVDARQIDRWEWGEGTPTERQALALTAALDLPQAMAPGSDAAEIAIELVAPDTAASSEAAATGLGGRLAGIRQWIGSRTGAASGWLKDLGADRTRLTTWVGAAVALLFFVLAAVGFSQAATERDRSDALQAELEATAAEMQAAQQERDALADRAEGLENDVAEARRQIDEAEAAARLQWEPLILENEELITENRFLRKAIVVSSAAGDVARVGLTFDGDPTPSALEAVLDVLAVEGVTATFFPSGAALEANPAGWLRAIDEGHELGNATYDRTPIDPDDLEATVASLKAWDRAIKSVTGARYPARWFRPPLMGGFENGVGTAEIRSVVARRGLITALWSVETFYALFAANGPREGGPDPDAAAVAAYVVGEADNGDIVLLQFGSLDIEAVPAILTGIEAKDLAAGTLTELFEAQEALLEGPVGEDGV